MDLELRTIISVPTSGDGADAVSFAFSTYRPTLVTACGTTVTVQDVSNDSISSRLRADARVEKVVYVGASRCFLLFLENGAITSYIERPNSIENVSEEVLEKGGIRAVVHANGSVEGGYVVFAKEESPSLWVAFLDDSGKFRDIFKLRSDIEGGQESVNIAEGVFAKVRGKVATNAKVRSSPIVALSIHPHSPIAAAAYENGILRVWDIKNKHQRKHFDAQLLLGEKITGMDISPDNILVICTTHGRLLSFRITSTTFKRGEEPALATSKMRERNRSFVKICFFGKHPAYVAAMTRTRRLLLRKVNNDGVILRSGRHMMPTRPLPVTQGKLVAEDVIAESRKVQKSMNAPDGAITLKYDVLFGFLAVMYQPTGNIYLYQRRIDRMPFVAKPVYAGIDSRFSEGRALKKPLVVAKEALFIQDGCMYSYVLRKETTTRLARLPPGDVRYMRVGRDENGSAIAALVFMYIDEIPDSVTDRPDATSFSKYVLCTKVSDSVEWNVSEPKDGRSGCFLNAEGVHDAILVVANTGHAASIYSFTSKKKKGNAPASRGVRRVKLGTDRAETVFRSPFCGWMAVVYYDALKKRIAVSRNTFRRFPSNANAEMRAEIAESDDGYLMDNETQVKLLSKEVVLDVRWQPRWTGRELRWFGAVLTNFGIYFVEDVLRVVARLEFVSLERTLVNFGAPSMLWMGPSIALVYGSSFYAVTLDGKADLIAALSHGYNAAILLAALPDRVVYAKPSGFAGAVAVASRPYSAMSVLIRSSLALSNGPQSGANIDEISEMLRTKDATQGSEELIEALIRSGLAPISYLVCVSEQGKHIVPPLRRATFLARIGDIRGALDVVETVYASLPDAKAFHAGTELHRLTQRIMNMAIVCGDFAAAKRCARLLGRRGTFEAFLESEGGFPALSAIVEVAKRTRNKQIATALKPLLEKSARSCIASDASRFPSEKEIRNTRRAIESMDVRSVSLGTQDTVRIAVKEEVVEEGSTKAKNSTSKSTMELLEAMNPKSVAERLIMLSDSPVVLLTSNDDTDEGFMLNREMGSGDTDGGVKQITNMASGDVGVPAIAGGGSAPMTVGGIPARTNVVYQPPGENYSAQASEMLKKGMSKVDSGRYDSALDDFESGIKLVGKHVKRLGVAPNQVPTALDGNTRLTLGVLVGYRMAMKLWLAMEEIRESAHINSLGGKITLAQLATAMAFVHGFDPRHSIGALNLACDANMEVGNFGTASKCLIQIRQLAKKDQVSDAVKTTLRNKYARCQQMGLKDSAGNEGDITLCFESLRVINQRGEKGLFCTVCPAKYSIAAGLKPGDSCTCCKVGIVML